MAGFADQVAAFERKAQDRIDMAFRKIALDLFTSVILKSPVDTGRFRANWQVAIGAAPEGTLELEDKTGAATISKADAAVAGLNGGETTYLVNNLPYAERLEDGYSGQAPAGMVRLTVQQYASLVERVGVEVRNL